jgi:HSP20 family protein
MVQTLQVAKGKKPFGREMTALDLPEGVPGFGFPFGRLFEDPWGWRSFADERSATPALDVVESNQAYVFAFELPGMKKEDVRIQVENGVFSISGERQFDASWREWNLHRAERRYGTFCRTFALPSGIDAEGAKAEMKDGVLYVTFPKTEEAKPRFLRIN